MRDMMTDAIEQLIGRTFKSIEESNSGIEYEALELMTEIWEEFKQIATAKTGKFHPMICNVKPYGLANHVIRTIHFAEQQCESYNLPIDVREKILMASLFHDIGKIPFHQGIAGFKDHGKWGYDWLKKRDIADDICVMVRDHMAHWEGDNKWHLAKYETKDWCKYTPIVAYSDYLASRKDIILRHERFMVLRNGKTEMTSELRFILDSYEGKYL